MKQIYRSRFLVVVNYFPIMLASPTDHVSIYEVETWRYKKPFLFFQPKNIFFGKSGDFQMTVQSGAFNGRDYDGNTLSLELT